MQGVVPTLEVEKIKGVLSNFSWKVVKQTITEKDLTLVITKDLLPLTEDPAHEPG